MYNGRSTVSSHFLTQALLSTLKVIQEKQQKREMGDALSSSFKSCCDLALGSSASKGPNLWPACLLLLDFKTFDNESLHDDDVEKWCFRGKQILIIHSQVFVVHNMN